MKTGSQDNACAAPKKLTGMPRFDDKTLKKRIPIIREKSTAPIPILGYYPNTGRANPDYSGFLIWKRRDRLW